MAPLTFRNVLLPLDGSTFAAAALPTASALAARFGADLVTISVAADEREAEGLRRQAVELVGDDWPESAVEVVVEGDPAEAVTLRAHELSPSVICMSTRGRGRIEGTLIGSVARAVLQRSTSPVVVLGPQADRPPALVGRPRRRPATWPEPLSTGPVVACVDGSKDSEAVLPHASRWARVLEGGLVILTVAEDAAPLAGGDRPNGFGPPDPRGYVDGLVARWSDVVPGTAGEVIFDPVGVASGLGTHLARHPAGLVAVTTHARTGAARLRFGATAADIVRRSPAPVLVVPAPQ